jgi:integrase
MVQLQLLTGMRPGEVCTMRVRDLDMSGQLWVYRPAHHKTLHHGHERVVYIGPKAQSVLRPFLKPEVAAFVFSPAEAEAERREQRHAHRKTPLSWGNVPGSNRRPRPLRQPGHRYTVASYRRAIARACETAFAMPEELKDLHTSTARARELTLPQADREEQCRLRRDSRRAWRRQHCWHPHQLRHNAGTRLRKENCLEAAQVILGHRTLTVTQVYAERNVEAAQKVMSEVG